MSAESRQGCYWCVGSLEGLGSGWDRVGLGSQLVGLINYFVIIAFISHFYEVDLIKRLF